MDAVITADDVIRGGACRSGVARVVQRLGAKLAAAMPPEAIMRLLPKSEHDYVVRAANLDGDGDGDGYGSGYGYGSGSGDGYGSGDGDGSGDGYGSGDGSGDGEDGYAYATP